MHSTEAETRIFPTQAHCLDPVRVTCSRKHRQQRRGTALSECWEWRKKHEARAGGRVQCRNRATRKKCGTEKNNNDEAKQRGTRSDRIGCYLNSRQKRFDGLHPRQVSEKTRRESKRRRAGTSAPGDKYRKQRREKAESDPKNQTGRNGESRQTKKLKQGKMRRQWEAGRAVRKTNVPFVNYKWEYHVRESGR